MSDPTSNLDPWHETLTRGHEPDHVSRRSLVISVAGLIAFAVVMHAGVWFLLKAELRRTREADRPRSIVESVTYPLEAPPLQPTQSHDRTPPEDLEAMYNREDHLFSAMGWAVNPKTHQARLPDALVNRVAADARQRQSRSRAGIAPATHPAAVVTPVQGADEGTKR